MLREAARCRMRTLITGIEMWSPVGHNGVATCAALRAGISRLVHQRDLVDRHGETLAASRIPDMDCPPGQPGRMAELATRVLQDAVARLSLKEQAGMHVSLLLGEPKRAGTPSLIVEKVRRALGEMGLGTSVAVDVYPDGHAGGARALLAIQSRLKRNPAFVELLAGVDSLSNMDAVAYFERHHRLRESRQPRGLHLGEAGACLVLQSERAALASRSPAYAAIAGVSVAQEPAPLWEQDAPRLSQGLTEALSGALEAARWDGASVRRVYIDLNGEPCRSHEWMLAATRVLDAPEVVHPADCIGDVGAATVPLLLGMAAMALHRDYARSPRLLVSCASDAGLRGGICVEHVRGREEGRRAVAP